MRHLIAWLVAGEIGLSGVPQTQKTLSFEVATLKINKSGSPQADVMPTICSNKSNGEVFRMRCSRVVLIVFGLAPVLSVFPQSMQKPPLSFEVASLKQNKETGPGIIGGSCRGVDTTPPAALPTTANAAPVRTVGPPSVPVGRCVFSRASLLTLVRFAYRVGPTAEINQVTGGPTWTSTETYDLNAKAEDPEATSQDQLREMLQSLLAGQFKLKFHIESKEVPGWDLVIAKGGHRLKEADATEQKPGNLLAQMSPNPGAAPTMTVKGVNAAISTLLGMLSSQLGRPVQDKTGLKGLYSFEMKYTPEAAVGSSSVTTSGIPQPNTFSIDPGTPLTAAFQDQLGLRLESQKVTVRILAIDSAEKPAVN